jgi:hypothetical protein
MGPSTFDHPPFFSKWVLEHLTILLLCQVGSRSFDHPPFFAKWVLDHLTILLLCQVGSRSIWPSLSLCQGGPRSFDHPHPFPKWGLDYLIVILSLPSGPFFDQPPAPTPSSSGPSIYLIEHSISCQVGPGPFDSPPPPHSVQPVKRKVV